MSNNDPTIEQFVAAVKAFHEVEEELDVNWTAHRPIQGEATSKVFAWRIVKAVLNFAKADAYDEGYDKAMQDAHAVLNQRGYLERRGEDNGNPYRGAEDRA